MTEAVVDEAAVTGAAAAVPRRGRRARLGSRVAALGLATLLASCAGGGGVPPVPAEVEHDASTGQPQTGTRLVEGVALYPRAIQLRAGPDAGTVVASVVSFAGSNGVAKIFHSTDAGTTFAQVGEVRDPGARRGLCCGSIYELPAAVGELPPGTLLWSASVGQDAGPDRRMRLPLWVSADAGRTWEEYSTVATAPNAGGLWEPELAVAADGRLALYAADESRQPEHGQVLVMSVSSDARTWSEPTTVFAAADPALRPGMPVVRVLPDGTYLMSYEVCGDATGNCRQMLRTSPDGLAWGDPGDLGTPVVSVAGTHFRHAPTLSWYDDGTPDGRLLAVGQMLYDQEAVAAGNGGRLFVGTGDPRTQWQVVEAPVRIAQPWDDYCPNYSSTLLPLPASGRLLEIATAYGLEDNACTAYFAAGRLPG